MAGRHAGANHPAVRRNNRAVIFRAIYELAPVARVDLARETGLNDKTITNIVDELLAQGLARETGYRATPQAGRRAMELAVDATARMAIGVDCTRREMTACLVDLAGNIHHTVTAKAPDPWLLPKIVPAVRRLVRRLRRSADAVTGDRIVGVGIGLPHLLRTDGDQYLAFDNVSPDTGSWQEFATRDELAAAFELPTYVDHHSNTGALAELWFGSGRLVDNFVLLNLGVGVSASLVINGDLYRGGHDSAGEIKQMTLDLNTWPQGGSPVDYIATDVIIDRFAAAIAAGEQTSLATSPKPTIPEIITAAQDGDPLAVRILDEVARDTAAVIGNIVGLLDPDRVLIGRELALAGDAFLDPVRDHLAARLSAANRDRVRIEAAGVEGAPAIGAATLALREFFRAPLDHPMR